jgi:hypothetical protein
MRIEVIIEMLRLGEKRYCSRTLAAGKIHANEAGGNRGFPVSLVCIKTIVLRGAV